MKTWRILIVMALLLGLSTEALARRYVRVVRPARRAVAVRVAEPVYPRFYMGILGEGTALIENEEGITTIVNSGGGFDLYAGLMFTRFIGLEASWFNSFHTVNSPTGDSPRSQYYTSTYMALEGLTLDLKLALPTRTFVTPFLTGGGGYYWALGEGGADLYGGGFQVGLGVDFALTRHISIGGKVNYRGLVLNEFLGYDQRGYEIWGLDNNYLNILNFGGYFQVTF